MKIDINDEDRCDEHDEGMVLTLTALNYFLKGHCVLFLCFRSEKNQNRMREGSKKNI